MELIQFIFQAEIVGDHRNKLTVCWLPAIVLNGIAEVGIEGIHVTSIPRDLDSVADSALDAGSGGCILFSYRGVENLGDRIDAKR